MPYQNLSGLDTNTTSVDSASTLQSNDTGGSDKRAELRNEMLRYGVDPKMLDDTALELYAAFRIPPEGLEKAHSLESDIPEAQAEASSLERLMALPKAVFSTLKTRICPAVRKTGLYLLVIGSAIAFHYKQPGGTHLHVDALVKGLTVL